MSNHYLPLVYNISFCDNGVSAPVTSVDLQPLLEESPHQLHIDLARCGPQTGYGATTTRSDLTLVPDSPATTRVLYCIHGNVMESCLEADHSSRRSSVYSVTGADHCHTGGETKIDVRARRKLLIASVLCLCFTVGEGLGGYLSNSLAIATDAAHLLTDFASFMISLFSLWMANRPATRRMSFGWYRAEVIGALTSVMMIWVVTGILVYMAVERVIGGAFEIDARTMLITAAIGVVVNLIMGLTLHQHGHSHGGSSHSHDENINVRAAFVHVVGDFIQSFGVLVASIVIFFKPEWQLVDPICTFLFSGLVMLTTFAIVRDALMVLMEGKPSGVDFELVRDTFMGIEGVKRIHNLRIWALSLDKIALSAHLAISHEVNPQKVLMTASRKIRSKFNFFEMTLQIEQFDERMTDCFKCQIPEK